MPRRRAKYPTIDEMREHAGLAARWLRAIANENRLLILCTLADREMSVGELNGLIPLSQSALSQHLSVLRRDGLVRTRRESQTIYYALADEDVSEVIALLAGRFCHR